MKIGNPPDLRLPMAFVYRNHEVINRMSKDVTRVSRSTRQGIGLTNWRYEITMLSLQEPGCNLSYCRCIDIIYVFGDVPLSATLVGQQLDRFHQIDDELVTPLWVFQCVASKKAYAALYSRTNRSGLEQETDHLDSFGPSVFHWFAFAIGAFRIRRIFESWAKRGAWGECFEKSMCFRSLLFEQDITVHRINRFFALILAGTAQPKSCHHSDQRMHHDLVWSWDPRFCWIYAPQKNWCKAHPFVGHRLRFLYIHLLFVVYLHWCMTYVSIPLRLMLQSM